MPSTDCTTFARIAVADLLDSLVAAVDAARAKLAESAAPNADAWGRAIDRAWDYILSVDVLAYDAASHTLLVESATEAGRSYAANGTCECRAYTHSTAQVCWHRAAAKIVANAVALAEQAAEAAEQAELTALAQELLDEARRAGCAWYGHREALAGARMQLRELEDYAQEWDRAAEAQRRAALAGRIVAARRQLAVAA